MVSITNFMLKKIKANFLTTYLMKMISTTKIYSPERTRDSQVSPDKKT